MPLKEDQYKITSADFGLSSKDSEDQYPDTLKTSINLGGQLNVSALGSKIDIAAEKQIPIPQAMAMDNSKLTQLKSSNPDGWLPVVKDFMNDPYTSSIYLKTVDTLNRLAVISSKAKIVNNDILYAGEKVYTDSTIQGGIFSKRVSREDIYGDNIQPIAKEDRQKLKDLGYELHGNVYINNNDKDKKRIYKPIGPFGTIEEQLAFDVFTQKEQKEKYKKRSMFFIEHNKLENGRLKKYIPEGYTKKEAKDEFEKAVFKEISKDSGLYKEIFAISDHLKSFRTKILFLKDQEQNNPAWRASSDEMLQDSINMFGTENNIDVSDLQPGMFRTKGIKYSSIGKGLNAVLPSIGSRVLGSDNTLPKLEELTENVIRQTVGQSFSADVADGVSVALPWVLSFILGGKSVVAGKAGLIKTVAKDSNRFVKWAVGNVGGATAMLPYLSGHILDAAESELHYQTFDKDLRLVVKDSDLTREELILKNGITTWVDAFTEVGGASFIGKIFSKVKIPGLSKTIKGSRKGIFSRFAYKTSKLKSQASIGSVAEETVEEMEAKAGNYLLTKAGELAGIDILESIDEQSPIHNAKEAKVGMAVVLIQAAIFGGPSTVGRILKLNDLSGKDLQIRKAYDEIEDNPESKESKSKLKDFLNVTNHGQTIVVNAKELRSLFQSENEKESMKTKLNLSNEEVSFINEQAESDGTIELSTSKLIVDSYDRDAFESILDLAQDIPGGYTIKEVEELKKDFNENKMSESVKIAKEVIDETNRTEDEYMQKLSEYTKALKNIPDAKVKGVNATINIFDAMVRSIAGKQGVSPASIIEKLQVNNIKLEGKRGEFSVDNMGDKVISLYEDSNLDTFAHESFHFLRNLMVDFKNNGAITDKQLLQDIGSIEKFEAGDQERGAEAFLEYLRTSKPPVGATSKVKNAFKTLRDILYEIYAKLKNSLQFYNIKMNPEISEVFDRMLITKEHAFDIVHDEALYKLLNYADLAGFTVSQKKDYIAIQEKQLKSIEDDLEKTKAKELPRVKSEARKTAKQIMKAMNVYDVMADIKSGGKINVKEIEFLNLSERTLFNLHSKGFLSTKKIIKASKLKSKLDWNGFYNYLHETNLLVSTARQLNILNGGKIKADDKFDVKKEEYNYFLDSKGLSSDEAAKQMSDMLGYKITEEELIEELRAYSLKGNYNEYNKMNKDMQKQHEAEAEAEILEDLKQSLAALASTHEYNSIREMIEDLARASKPAVFVNEYINQQVAEYEVAFAESSYAVADSNMIERINNLIDIAGQKASNSKSGRKMFHMNNQKLKSDIALELKNETISEITNLKRPLDAIREKSKKTLNAIKKEDWGSVLSISKEIRILVEKMKQKIDLSKTIEKDISKIKKTAMYRPKVKKKSKIFGPIHYQIQKLAFNYNITKKAPIAIQSKEWSIDSIFEKFNMRFNESDLPAIEIYKNLSLDAFENVVETINFMSVVGQSSVQQAENERRDQAEAEAKEANSNMDKAKSAILPGKSKFKRVLANFAGSRYYLKNLLAISRKLDNYENALGKGTAGIIEKIAYDKLSDSEDAILLLLEDAIKISLPAYDSLNKLKKIITSTKISKSNLPLTPSIIQEQMGVRNYDFEMLLSVVLNLGTLDNYKKLQDGYINDTTNESELGEAEIEKIVQFFDSNEFWDAVELLWEAQSSILPAKKAAYKTLTYTELKTMEPRAFNVSVLNKNGEKVQRTIKGGYYPIAYDTVLNDRYKSKKEVINNQTGPQSDGFISVAGNDTKERVSFTGVPIKLDFSVFGTRLYEAAHNAAYMVAARDVNAMMGNEEFRKNLKRVLGETGRTAFFELVSGAGNPIKEHNKFIKALDAIVTAKALWGNFTSALMQHAGVTQGIATIGKRNFLNAQLAFYASPLPMIKLINEKSIMMKNRQGGPDVDIRRGARSMLLSSMGKTIEFSKEIGFIGIRILDTSTSYPMWWGSYTLSIKEDLSETEAIKKANKLISETQGSGREIDKIWMQHRPILRHFAKFMSATSAFQNRQLTGMAALAKGKVAVSDYLNLLFAELFAPALYSGALRLMGSGMLMRYMLSDDDDDKEDFWNKFWVESISFATQGMPFVRNASDLITRLSFNERVFDRNDAPIERPIADTFKLGKSTVRAIINEDDEDLVERFEDPVKQAIILGTDYFRIPLGTTIKRLDKFIKTATGSEDD